MTTQKDLLRDIYADVQHIKKLMDGNGGEGLLEKSNRHEKKLNQLDIVVKIVSVALGSGWLFVVVKLMNII